MKIETLIRPHLLKFSPYSSARSEFKGKASIFLDANENPFETEYNRYPDPLQKKLKELLSTIKGVETNTLFLGNGSDEAIDLIIRLFCEPSDSITILPPTYGMYRVSAETSNIAIQEISLTADFRLDVEKILANQSKLLFICSPNNPTGNAFKPDVIEQIVQQYKGIVVVDEAYIDFSSQESMCQYIDRYPNLIILQTLSKAWGLANLRLGMAIANCDLIHYLNAIKPPYNINGLTQAKALEMLQRSSDFKDKMDILFEERTKLTEALNAHTSIEKVYPSDTNFILFKVNDASALYRYLIAQDIVVRNRNTVHLCKGCIRVTVGTPRENERFLEALGTYFNEQTK